MNKFENKRILFLSPKFFGLEKGIVETLEVHGAEVKYYDERCVSSTFGKIILKKAKFLLYKRSEKYIRNIIQKESDEFDYVLIFTADALSKTAVNLLKTAYCNAKMVLYLWDDVASSKNVISLFNIFDTVYSFDSKDCEKYGVQFRPLYYNNVIKKIGNEVKKEKYYKYKIMFCGTIHSDRYGITKRIIDECREAGFNAFYYPFLPSKIMYYYYKMRQKTFKESKKSDFKYISLKQEDLAHITYGTEIVLDVTHPSQSGLTMRTIESIGLHKKIITTNKQIVNYDFYNKNNVCIIDRKNPIIPQSFWQSKYKMLNQEIYDKYSIDAFVDEILN